MRRINWKTVSTLVTMSVMAGCQENTVSAPRLTPSSAALMTHAPSGRPALSLGGGAASNTTVDFTVGANGGVFYTGNHAVVFPAGSICDPSTSSYGPATWDAPCAPLTSALRIRAVVSTVNGQSSVDFSPSIRFVPTSNPSRWVWMYMYAPAARSFSGNLSRFNILYLSRPGATLVDESVADATLRTYVDTWSGMAARRIKHFSGYVVAGMNCIANPDDPANPTCSSAPGDSTSGPVP